MQINDNGTDILQKSDLLEENIKELYDKMKNKKELKLALHRIESENSNTALANQYLDIENEINKHSNLTSAERKKLLYDERK